jgi:hypothetical protein
MRGRRWFAFSVLFVAGIAVGWVGRDSRRGGNRASTTDPHIPARALEYPVQVEIWTAADPGAPSVAYSPWYAVDGGRRVNLTDEPADTEWRARVVFIDQHGRRVDLYSVTR